MERRTQSRRRQQCAGLFFQLYNVLFVFFQASVLIYAWCMIQAGYGPYAQTTLMLTFIFLLCLVSLLRTYGALEVGRKRILDLFIGQFLSICVSDGVVFLSAILVIKQLPHIGIILVALLIQLAFSLVWSFSANSLYFRWFPPKRVAILYIDENAYESMSELHLSSTRFQAERIINLRGLESRLPEILGQLDDLDGVFLCGLPASMRNDLMKELVSRDLDVYVRPKISDVLLCTAQQKYMFHVPMLSYEGIHHSLLLRAGKRLMDIVVSAVALILTSPVMVVVAVLIKREDGGPVFYRQDRLTRGGRIFRIMKFRSMRTDAEKDGVARLASCDDDRITKVGRFIRATRIDELPQLLNILKGDMSLVGPRPERPEIAAQYEELLPEFKLRLRVKAGLTGYAQVNGKYNTTPYDKLQMDLIYISTMSIPNDLKILLQTAQILFQKDSTEGVAEGQVTANSVASHHKVFEYIYHNVD